MAKPDRAHLRVVPDPEDEKPERTRLGLADWLMVLAGAFIVGSAGYTFANLSDRTTLTVLVPGVVIGLVLLAISTRLRRPGRRGPGPGRPIE